MEHLDGPLIKCVFCDKPLELYTLKLRAQEQMAVYWKGQCLKAAERQINPPVIVDSFAGARIEALEAKNEKLTRQAGDLEFKYRVRSILVLILSIVAIWGWAV